MAMIEAYRIGVELVLGGDLVAGIEALIPSLNLLNGGLVQANANAKALAVGLDAVAETAPGIGRTAEALQRLGAAMATMKQTAADWRAPGNFAVEPPKPRVPREAPTVAVPAAEGATSRVARMPVATSSPTMAPPREASRPPNTQALAEAIATATALPATTIAIDARAAGAPGARPAIPFPAKLPVATEAAWPVTPAPRAVASLAPSPALPARPRAPAAADAIATTVAVATGPTVMAEAPAIPVRAQGARPDVSRPPSRPSSDEARPAEARKAFPKPAGWAVPQPAPNTGWAVLEAAVGTTARPIAARAERHVIGRDEKRAAADPLPTWLRTVPNVLPHWSAGPPGVPAPPRSAVPDRAARAAHRPEQVAPAAQPQAFHPQGRQAGPIIEHVTYVQLDERTIARAVTRQQLRMMGGQVSGTLRADPSIVPQYGAHLLEG